MVCVTFSTHVHNIDVIKCSDYQVFNSVLGCVTIVCPSGLVLVARKCYTVNTIQELFNCTLVLLDRDYLVIDNSSVQIRGEVFDVLGHDSDGHVLICNNTDATIPIISMLPGYYEILFIGGAVSIIASVLVILTYSIFKELRSFPIILLMNLAIAFLMGDIALLFGGIVSIYLSSIEVLCILEPIFVHYFILSRFSWMNCLGFEYVCRYVSVYRLQVNTDNRKCNKLIGYMLFGWGVPFIITLITVIVNFSVEGLVEYGSNVSTIQSSRCWIGNSMAEIISVGLPIALGISVNLTMFIVIGILMCVVSRNSVKELQRKRRIAQIRLIFGMLSVLGGIWLFGLISLIVARDSTWAAYTFFASDFIQSVSIAITFLTTKKVICKYWALLRCNSLINICKYIHKSSTQNVIMIEMKRIENI